MVRETFLPLIENVTFPALRSAKLACREPLAEVTSFCAVTLGLPLTVTGRLPGRLDILRVTVPPPGRMSGSTDTTGAGTAGRQVPRSRDTSPPSLTVVRVTV